MSYAEDFVGGFLVWLICDSYVRDVNQSTAAFERYRSDFEAIRKPRTALAES
jgi:hypothetical protein